MDIYKIHSKPQSLKGYSKKNSVPAVRWSTAKMHDVLDAFEDIWAKSAYYAYKYAMVTGKRFLKGEAAIAKHPTYAFNYALYVLHGKRFPAGEAAINSQPALAERYRHWQEPNH